MRKLPLMTTLSVASCILATSMAVNAAPAHKATAQKMDKDLMVKAFIEPELQAQFDAMAPVKRSDAVKRGKSTPSADIRGTAPAPVLERLDLTYLTGGTLAGTAANNVSIRPALDEAGDSVVFTSLAGNLTVDDTHGYPQVFVADFSGATPTITLVSRGTTGGGNAGSGLDEFVGSSVEGNEFHMWANSISNDGNKIVFSSTATDLTADADTNAGLGDGTLGIDVFLYDRTGAPTITRLSQTGATQLNGDSFDGVISGDGNWVAFVTTGDNVGTVTDANDPTPVYREGKLGADIYLRELGTGALTLVSRTIADANTAGNGDSLYPSISGDGSIVAFQSRARDIYSEAMPVPTTGLSALFTTGDNLFNVFSFNRGTGTVSNHSLSNNGTPPVTFSDDLRPHVSKNGQWITFVSQKPLQTPGGTSEGSNIFVVDRTAGPTSLRMVNSDAAGARVFRSTMVNTAAATTDDGLKTFFRVGYTAAADTDGLAPHHAGVLVKTFAATTGSAGTTTWASVKDDGLGGDLLDDAEVSSFGAPVGPLGSNWASGSVDAPSINSTGSHFAWTTESEYGGSNTWGLNTVYRYVVGTKAADRASVGDASIDARIGLDDDVNQPLGTPRLATSANGRYTALISFGSNLFTSATTPSAFDAYNQPMIVVIDHATNSYELANVDESGFIITPVGFGYPGLGPGVGLNGFPYGNASGAAIAGWQPTFQGVSVSNNGDIGYMAWTNAFDAALNDVTCVFMADVMSGTSLGKDLYLAKGSTALGSDSGVYFAMLTSMNSAGTRLMFNSGSPVLVASPPVSSIDTYYGYVWDTTTDAFTLASLNGAGNLPNGEVLAVAMDDSGANTILYNSASTDMQGTPGDVPEQYYLNRSGTVSKISTRADGTDDGAAEVLNGLTGNALNAAGTLAVLNTNANLTGEASANNVYRQFLKNISGGTPSTGALTLVTPGLVDNADPAVGTSSDEGAISPDGTLVAFTSDHPFTTPDGNGQQTDIFEYTVSGATYALISQNGGVQDDAGTPGSVSVVRPVSDSAVYTFRGDFSNAFVDGDNTAITDAYIITFPSSVAASAKGGWSMYE